MTRDLRTHHRGGVGLDWPRYVVVDGSAVWRRWAVGHSRPAGSHARRLAHGRSGDKGDIANIGVLARRPEFTAVLRQQVTTQAVSGYLAHFAKGKVERFEWPGLHGFNFLLHGGLGGGGIASLRHDPQGKAMAQILMDLPVKVPARWLEDGGPLAGWRDTDAQAAEGARA